MGVLTETVRCAARPRWDPRREPCVPVFTGDGTRELVGLVDALRRAGELSGLAVTTPGETVALLEYLLAICYAAQGAAAGPETPARAAEWLDTRPDDQWDLFHPTEPLGQNSLLAPYLDEHGTGPAQLVIERAGDYNQFFDHHHLDRTEPLPAAAAFRAMLAQHAYGPGGRARVSGKETLGPTLTNLGLGRLAARIRVVALGPTLQDTLLLNLLPLDGDGAGTFNHTWTVSPTPRRGFRVKPRGRSTDGPADLHSVLGRSILLRPVAAGGQLAVDRVLLAAGELLTDPPARDAVYPRGEDEPLRPSATRAFWREAHALYAAVANRREGDLYDRVARHSGTKVTLWAVGLITRHTSVVTWVSDTFPFVRGRERELRYAAERGSHIAEYIAACLSRAAYVAWTVTYPNPKPSDKADQLARFDAGPEYWMYAAVPFHVLLEETSAAPAKADLDEALVAYAADLAREARRFLNQRLDSLPATSRGYRTRVRATRLLDAGLTGLKAPDELKGKRA
ncbi:type I-E CRISPR-associated protein Cse1/CasA [Streptomyces sp. NPDC004539]|uniref:type I-E CRISPR-associated protein Cse1/CasA n=1 Tax=Streptomyces sp. NPDC004539 TaxID=3154280 RepID=UPI00339E3FDB